MANVSKIKGLCVTCLSSNRNINPLENDQKIAIMEFLLEFKLQTPINLCWECSAQLINICKFKMKAKNSINVIYALENIKVESGSALPNKVQCLSKLRKTKITKICIGSHYMKSVEIKSEPLEPKDDSVNPIKIEPSFDVPIVSDESMELATRPKPESWLSQTKNKIFIIKGLHILDGSVTNNCTKPSPNSICTNPQLTPTRDGGQPKLVNNLHLNVGQSKINPNPSLSIHTHSKETKALEPGTDYMVDISTEKDIDAFLQKPGNRISQLLDKFKENKISKKDIERKRAERRVNSLYYSKTYKCETCILGFASQKRFAHHNDKFHLKSRGQFVCAICSRRFRLLRHARSHVVLHYHEYECVLCDQQFEYWSRDAFLKHYNIHHQQQELPFDCYTCNKQFQTLAKLRRHMQDTHYQFKCECGVSFATRYHMERHTEKGHTGKSREIYCAICKTFKHYSHGKHHARRFECHDCGKRFPVKAYLSKHIMVVHLKKKDFKCDLCDKQYCTVYELNRHKVRHTSGPIRNNVCDVCGAAFTTMQTLRSHMVRHTGVRPYACDQCSSTFGFSASLYTHKKLVHEKRKRNKKKTPKSRERET